MNTTHYMSIGEQIAYYGIKLEWDEQDKIWIATWTSLKTHGSTKSEALDNLGQVMDILKPGDINILRNYQP